MGSLRSFDIELQGSHTFMEPQGRAGRQEWKEKVDRLQVASAVLLSLCIEQGADEPKILNSKLVIRILMRVYSSR